MFSIVHGSGPLTPEFLQLCLGIVESGSPGRVRVGDRVASFSAT